VFTLANGTKKTVAFEYETPECKHSKKELQDKRERLKTKKQSGASCFDDVIFIGKNEYISFLIDAVGGDFALQRGSEVAEYIRKIQTSSSDVFVLPLAEQGV
jgi:hypothetical protein